MKGNGIENDAACRQIAVSTCPRGGQASAQSVRRPRPTYERAVNSSGPADTFGHPLHLVVVYAGAHDLVGLRDIFHDFQLSASTFESERAAMCFRSLLPMLSVWFFCVDTVVIAADPRPNFIVIMTDDQGYADVGCYGARDLATPHLDRLAAEGMRFTDFYALAAVCSPSRAALLTGRYPARAGVTKVLFPKSPRGLAPEQVTLAELLRRAGYVTMCVGKWHLGHHAPFLPTDQGFDEYFGIPYSNDMGHLRGNGQRDASRPPLPLMRNDAVIELEPDQATLTRRYTAEAVEFIKRNRQRPFFLYLPHTFPHSPWFASDAFRGRSKRGLYGDMIEEIDWSVGQIMDALQAEGIDDRTMVLFTSDNGPSPHRHSTDPPGSAEPLRGAKFSIYEGGRRVPCLVRWPHVVPAGVVCDKVATAMDVMPTLASAAGIFPDADRPIDGYDLGRVLRNRTNAHSPYQVLGYYQGRRLTGVRKGPWKLLLPAGKKRAQVELYNLDQDVGETRNVAEQEADRVSDLKASLERLKAQVKYTPDDALRSPEPLTKKEKEQGWRYLFDGRSMKGWRTYRQEQVGPGWTASSGILRLAQPRGGDLITTEQFSNFELVLDYAIAPGGNSGLMFHVTEEEPAPWQTGPEVQIHDNIAGHDPKLAGWLYGLFEAPVDATHPPGHWNRLRLKITEQECGIHMNGVLYCRFDKGSEQWNTRVQESKFSKFPKFGVSNKGHICLQDHGNPVAFRNIKIRPL